MNAKVFFHPHGLKSKNEIEQGQSSFRNKATLKAAARRNKKKQSKKKKQIAKKLFESSRIRHTNNQETNLNYATNMASWAETFNVAATWQLKHQLAHWKARAKALEYENKVLHDVIRKNCLKAPRTDIVPSESEEEDESIENQEEEEDEERLDITEEFIAFYEANAPYKEDARLEREKYRAKLRAAEEALKQQMESPPDLEDIPTSLKELYGKQWQRIGAIEMASEARFIEETDQNNTKYWPVIPLNFG